MKVSYQRCPQGGRGLGWPKRTLEGGCSAGLGLACLAAPPSAWEQTLQGFGGGIQGWP